MKELIDLTDPNDIQHYIEKQHNVKLHLRKTNLNECRKQGHPPHWDTGKGTGDHMPWCSYSASILKTNQFAGGNFNFLDDSNRVVEVVDKDKHFGKALVFSVEHKHSVDPHTHGDRVVDLYWWEITSTSHPNLM